MTSRLLFTLFLTTAPAFALPFALRTPPSGIDYASSGQFSMPMEPVVADFDRDGHRDWYWGGNVISRFPKSGTLELPAIHIPQYHAAKVVPLCGTALDVDQDGDMDIVRINRWDGWGDTYTLQVFLNDGKGSFGIGWRTEWSGPAFNEGEHSYRMVPGDFDRDGDQDLALVSTYDYRNRNPTPERFEGSLKILWNKSGQFATSTVIQSSGFTDRTHLVAGDLDHDGDLDLICSDQTLVDEDGGTTPYLRTFLNNGSGSFTGSTEWSVTDRIVLRDLNRDSYPDLILEPYGSDRNLYVRLNDRAGGLSSKFPVHTPPEDTYLSSFAAGDVNEDGIDDLVIAEKEDLFLRPGLGNGHFGDRVTIATLPSAPSMIQTDDLDQDGDQDILIRFGNGTFGFVENRAPRLHPEFSYQLISLPGIRKLETADMNLDGIPDLLALDPDGNKIHFLAGKSNGTFAAPEFKLTSGDSASDFAVADLNRDGRPDLAYVLPGKGQVRQVLQNDLGFFMWLDTKVGDMPGVSMIRAGEAAATNGSPDLMTASPSAIRWYINHGYADAWSVSDVRTGISPSPLGILPASFDRRWGDVGYYLAADGGALAIRGDQHFFLQTPPWIQVHQLLQIQDQPQTGEMMAADLDRDGAPDIVFGNDGGLSWWKPTHLPGSVPTVVDTQPAGTIRGLAAVDWNRDGFTDILCASTEGLFLHLRNGNGNGWTRQTLIHTTDISDVVAMDIDRDGRTDAVVSVPGTGNIRIVYNRSQIVSLGDPVTPPGNVLGLKPGQNGYAFSIPVHHPGRPAVAGSTHLPEQPIAVTRGKIRIYKAEPNGSGWKKGVAMTKTEIDKVLTSVSLVSGGKTIGSVGPNDLDNDGSLIINHHAVLGQLDPLAPGATRDLHFRVSLKSTAGNAGYTAFYLVMNPPDAVSARACEDGELGLTGTLGRNAETRVEILPNLTPLQEWRQGHFGNTADSGESANDHDFDRDGLPNLIEYVIGTDPKNAEPSVNAARMLQLRTGNGPDENAFVQLWCGAGALADPKMRFTIEQSSDLVSWTTLASCTGGGAWTGVTPGTFSVTGLTRLTFGTGAKPSVKPRYFVRLKVDELP